MPILIYELPTNWYILISQVLKFTPIYVLILEYIIQYSMEQLLKKDHTMDKDIFVAKLNILFQWIKTKILCIRQ